MNILKILTLIIFPVIVLPLSAQELNLKPFETDGCTLFVDGTTEKPGWWRHCCVEHDLRYWYGGSMNERDEADLQIKSCVEKTAGINWARLIYAGIRTGHYSPVKNKYQWSWGWSSKRDHGPLTNVEKQYVLKELRSLNPQSVEGLNIEDFIKLYFSTRRAL